jgi:hypothetical protein
VGARGEADVVSGHRGHAHRVEVRRCSHPGLLHKWLVMTRKWPLPGALTVGVRNGSPSTNE